MAFNYSNARSTAERLIASFGKDQVLIQDSLTGSNYDPTIAEVRHTIKAAKLNYKLSDIDGTLVEMGDQIVYISTEGLSVTPAKADKVELNGEEWDIIDIWPLEPTDIVVFWKVQVRK